MKLIATKAEWDELKKGSGDKVIAVDFTASWCGPCRMIGPKFAEMENQFPDIIFCKIDVDENDEVAAEEGVEAMPTFKFYKNGSKLDELVGANENKLREKLEECGKK